MDKPVKESILKKAVRFIKYNRLFTMFLTLIFILIYFTLFGEKGILARIQLENEKSSLEQQLKDENKTSDALKKEIEELNTSKEKIEKIAREKYGMTKEGEIIYPVIIDSSKDKNE